VPLLIITIPVGWYLLSPLWTRTTIYEESPLAAAGVTVPGVAAPTSTPRELAEDTPAVPALEQTPVSPPTPTPVEPTPTSEPTVTVETHDPQDDVPEPTPDSALEPTAEIVSDPTPAQESEPVSEPTPEPTPEVFTPRLVSSGQLSGADDFHFAAGTALLIETEPGVYVLRLEEFSVRNGPDLFVYLAAGPDYLDDAAINLGGLRATDGSINYDVPAGTDISQFQGVVIWCRAFAVFFGSAPLTPI
jgi:hypothetical protein